MRLDAIEPHPIYPAAALAAVSTAVAYGGDGPVMTAVAAVAMVAAIALGIVAIQPGTEQDGGSR